MMEQIVPSDARSSGPRPLLHRLGHSGRKPSGPMLVPGADYLRACLDRVHSELAEFHGQPTDRGGADAGQDC